MGKSALQGFSTKENIEQSWKLMLELTPKHKRDNIDSNGTSISIFEKQRLLNIGSLSIQIRNNTYHPDDLTAYFIPKPHSKKERVICVPTIKDRLAQRSLLQYLHEKGYKLNNQISYGFIKGLGDAVKMAGADAIKLRNKYPWAYKADISAFFDNIHREKLKELVRSKIPSKSIHPIIFRMIDSEINRSAASIDQKLTAKGIVKNQGLRQGMPISPYLSNLYLAEFDKAAIKLGLPMIRYADDIIAFGNSEEDCLKIHEFCKNELDKLELKIPEVSEKDKNIIAPPNQTIEFLGLGISKDKKAGYKLIVTDDQIAKIKTKLFEMTDINYCHKNN
ncbi:MAG TPA: hypothetical protein DIW64_08835, partial [Cellvibrio sp.]|nr:hypothetical protein [Cellvibrio sp.]